MRRWERDGRATREQTRLPGTGAAALSPGGRPHFPCPKVARPRGSARRGGARGEVDRPARSAIPPPPPPPTAATGQSAPPRGRGPAGGVAGDTQAAERAQRGARGGGRRPRVMSRPAAPAGGGGSGGPRSPRGSQGWEPARAAGDTVRSARAKLAAAAPPRRLLPPLPAPQSPLLAGPTPPSSVPPGCSPAAV